MNSNDSEDSSADEESGTSTNVVLGYASKTPAQDTFSQLGGHPLWLTSENLPPACLATCKVCNSLLSLLLQLNCDLPGHFPHHDRRLYVWACRRPPCKRKDGSVRAFRASRITVAPRVDTNVRVEKKEVQAQRDVGSMLFGTKAIPLAGGASNPFSMQTAQVQGSAKQGNPFAAATAPLASLAAKPPQNPDVEENMKLTTLPETFAQKASISSHTATIGANVKSEKPTDPWPPESSFPQPYAKHYLEDDIEYLYPTDLTTKASSSPTNYSSLMDVDASSSEAPTKDEPGTYESPHDTAFQHFADRLAQNPEQVLRYDFGGQPLLYSKTDAVGMLFSSSAQPNAKVATSHRARIPACSTCASPRVFELQLTPHAIAVLEEDMDAATALKEGMEWGSIVVGSCSVDCVPQETATGEVGYVEEWVGVQWEETVIRR